MRRKFTEAAHTLGTVRIDGDRYVLIPRWALEPDFARRLDRLQQRRNRSTSTSAGVLRPITVAAPATSRSSTTTQAAGPVVDKPPISARVCIATCNYGRPSDKFKTGINELHSARCNAAQIQRWQI